MGTNIFLEGFRSKKSVDTSGGMQIPLKGNRKLLPVGDFSDVISSMEQYMKEREACNKIRLTCQVNPICSNVLFNRISEIVKYEGSEHVTFLNYGIGGEHRLGVETNINEAFENNQVIYKPETMSFWSGSTMKYQSFDQDLVSKNPSDTLSDAVNNTFTGNLQTNGMDMHPTNAIRDMQLSRDDDNGDHFVYHCGLDIFNNHLIRSNTFKTICKLPDDTDVSEEAGYTAFNTITDLMRDVNGYKVVEKIGFPVSANVPGNTKFTALHMYLYDDILTFSGSVNERLIEKHNGWYGFNNKAKIKSYMDFGDNADPKDMRIERPIMYMAGGDFVDMYPGRDLYSFVPKYNKYRDRMEKNWNYCITYPSSSTTSGFDDIIETNNNSLKTIYFDENTRSDSGAMQLVMYSKAMHGLAAGDRVNIYKTYEVETTDDEGNTKTETVTEKIIDSVEVDEIVDPFIFTTFMQNVQISKNWVMLSSEDLASSEITINEVKYTRSNDGGRYYYDENFNRYYIINDRYINLDTTAQNITYKKVVGGIECDYYVRIFSRLPNFKFASGDTSNEFMIYNKPVEGSEVKPSLLEVYQHPMYDFESHISRLAFAKNVYSDDIGEIVFTDDIDIANIHDNLGRPLTDVYITIVKNNAGYKRWYGYDGAPVDISFRDVEFSHCFGKITCGFEMSDESIDDIDTNNIKTINNIQGINLGYSADDINYRNKEEFPFLTPEEINFESDINFYGDLCYYDNFNAVEHSIQPILHRFNTSQRECRRALSGDYFTSLAYDEINNDDYDSGDAFTIKTYKMNECNAKKEGYYYIPHYKIPVKSFGKLQTVMPQFLTINSLISVANNTATITTQEYHYLTPGDKAVIYDQENDKYYYLTTITGKTDSERVFTCKISDESGNFTQDIDGDNVDNYTLFKIDNMEIPSYAHLLKDGTCRYIWRDVINNGSINSDSSLEEYPFTNGAFYINKKIDIYVRRQDPYDKYGLYSESDIDAFGIVPTEDEINNYASEDEIQC